MAYTKDFIKSKLLTDDRWLIRGILAIYDRQTHDEQGRQETLENNGVGFNGADAPFLSSIAEQVRFKHRHFLTPKQNVICRKMMVKYAGQLTEIANARETN